MKKRNNEVYHEYALKNEVLTHISKVERGLKCGCKCSCFGKPLIAYQGEKKTHYF